MNQILYVEKNKGRKKSKIITNFDKKKMFLIVSIILIIFGVAFIGKGTFAVIRNNDYLNKIENAVPVITIEQDGQYAIINVEHIRNIDSVTYNWNSEENIKVNADKSNSISEKIELPKGNNTLNVVAMDVTGKKQTAQQEFSIETGKDIQKPTIDLIMKGNYVEIVAKDDSELSYVTYRWNNDQETILHPIEGDIAKIQKEIEVQRGQNTLIIIAVDASNNTSKLEKEIAGLLAPTVTVTLDGDSLLITAKHETGIDRIEYTLNGQKYSIQYSPGPIMQYKQKMVEGYNKISVKAYSTEGTLGTYEGETTYTPQAQ